MANHSEKPLIPPQGEPENDLYHVVANRQCAYDSMLWSTPVISLAGLAFLFNIALSPDTAKWPRCYVSFLAICFAMASAHLLYKHRYGEKNDSEWLKKYEEMHFPSCLPVHGRGGTDPRREKGIIKRWSAYWIWQVLLVVFVIAAGIIFWKACCDPSWFQSSQSKSNVDACEVVFRSEFVLAKT